MRRTVAACYDPAVTDKAPTQRIFAALRYKDAAAAIAWLRDAFGFAEHVVYANDDGTIAHAELSLGGGDLIMLGSGKDDVYGRSPRDGGTPSGSLYVVVDDPDAHHGRAKAAGAEIVRELNNTDYGSREYSARDPEGHVWSFGTYQPHEVAGNIAPTVG